MVHIERLKKTDEITKVKERKFNLDLSCHLAINKFMAYADSIT